MSQTTATTREMSPAEIEEMRREAAGLVRTHTRKVTQVVFYPFSKRDKCRYAPPKSDCPTLLLSVDMADDFAKSLRSLGKRFKAYHSAARPYTAKDGVKGMVNTVTYVFETVGIYLDNQES